MNRSILLLVCGITLLMTMGISTLLPLLPFLASHFGASPDESWKIIVALALLGLVCIPFVGVWADRHGRKRVLVPALVMFAAGGFGCMFARSFTELLVFRVIQGVGSAPMGLLYSTIVADTWEGERRVKAMSYCSISLGLGTAAGPAIGRGSRHAGLAFAFRPAPGDPGRAPAPDAARDTRQLPRLRAIRRQLYAPEADAGAARPYPADVHPVVRAHHLLLSPAGRPPVRRQPAGVQPNHFRVLPWPRA